MGTINNKDGHLTRPVSLLGVLFRDSFFKHCTC